MLAGLAPLFLSSPVSWVVEEGWLLRGKSPPLLCLLPAAGEENLMTQA